MYGGYYLYKDNGMIIVFKGKRKATTYILYRGIRILILTFNCDIYKLPSHTSEYIIIYVYRYRKWRAFEKKCMYFIPNLKKKINPSYLFLSITRCLIRQTQ